MYKKSLKIPKEVGNQKMLNEGKKTHCSKERKGSVRGYDF
jgi:hypothetical protein